MSEPVDTSDADVKARIGMEAADMIEILSQHFQSMFNSGADKLAAAIGVANGLIDALQDRANARVDDVQEIIAGIEARVRDYKTDPETRPTVSTDDGEG